MRVMVTGAAGFIGSRIARALVREGGNKVVGVDSFESNYPRWIKERNLEPLLREKSFKFLELNLLQTDLPHLLRDGRSQGSYHYVFHQAATAGVRTSWGEEFDNAYVPNNIIATKQLLHAAKGLKSLRRFVYASSSSVYGDALTGILREEMKGNPLSPYGVTKAAAEQLCVAFHSEFSVPTIALRYFSVYGEGQRPDMFAHIFTRAIYEGRPVQAHQGDHARDFTNVHDVVRANLLARTAPPGGVYNVGGGEVTSLNRVIELLQELTGKQADIRWVPNPPGNVKLTAADLTRARQELKYEPRVGIAEGLAQEVSYLRDLYGF